MTDRTSLLASAAPHLMGRNRIINGDFRVAQYGSGSVLNTNGAYVIDRWALSGTQVSKLSFQPNLNNVTLPAGGSAYYGGVQTAAAYAVASTDFFRFYQVIEGLNIADWQWGTANAQDVNLSFLVRSSLTGTFGGSIRTAAQDASYVFSYSIPVANVWTKVSIKIPGPTIGTWGKDTSAGLDLFFSLGTGTAKANAAGGWYAAEYFSVTGETPVVGTLGATWYITDVQLEAGHAATAFERKLYSQALLDCQRYYETLYCQNGAEIVPLMCQSTSSCRGIIKFKVTKRIAPNVTVVSGSGTMVAQNAAGSSAGGTLTFDKAQPDSIRTVLTGASGLVAGNASSLVSINDNTQLNFSAEL